MRKWPLRIARLAPFAVALLPLIALARGGGGQHYSSGRGDHDSSGGGGGGDSSGIVWAILELTINYPHIMCPLLMIGGLAYYFYNRANNPTAKTQRAFDQREAERNTRVSSDDLQRWVSTLKKADPGFELAPVLDKAKTLFLAVQDAWFKRDLAPVRPFLSDAMFQRLATQLKLLSAQGVRNAISDVQVLELQLLGVDHSQWFDTLNVRVRAQMRDLDVPAQLSDAEAVAATRKVSPDPFIEIWSFLRKPGAQTKIGADLYQGKCPNCGAPFKGGAANNCEFCGAVVNSGNYDWTLAEITQGVEHQPAPATVTGLNDARATDPALNLEILQDRASLIFWKWIDAQSAGDAKRLTPFARPEFIGGLEAELRGLAQQGRHKVFLECAVGSVAVRQFVVPAEGNHQAHVELRWSAKMGIGPAQGRPPELPTVPQRWVFILERKAGATTSTANGVSTNRCPQCNAPISDSVSPSCQYCGQALDSGDRDWVLASADTFERWNAVSRHREPPPTADARIAAPGEEHELDEHERERLIYMMAALAAADGEVSDSERKMLQEFAKRWQIPWSKVEMALTAGPALFERLMPAKGSPDAIEFLLTLGRLALVDGKVDRKERQMLEAMADKLELRDVLGRLLGNA